MHAAGPATVPPWWERSPVVPDFFVIGAYRCGTTSLYRSLRQHPQIFLPLEKEPNFYAVDGNPDASDVLRSRSTVSGTAYDALYAAAGPYEKTGDISPEYLRNPRVAPRLAQVAPNAPLVAVLRNPIERAWSDYLLHIRDGNERCDRLRDALAEQAERQLVDHRAGHYLDSGFYAAQLARYYALFPRSQVQVHLFEDLMADRQAVLSEVFRHVGVDPSFAPEPEAAVNASGIPDSKALAAVLRARKVVRPLVNRALIERARPAWERFLSRRLRRPVLDHDDWALLAGIYHDDVLRLGDLLDRDLSHWLVR